MSRLDDMIDRAEVIELCKKPHWIYDHATWDDLDDVFVETLSMPTLAQASAPGFDPENYLHDYLVSRDDMKHGMALFKAGLLTQHLVAGHHAVLAGDVAVCWAHSINVHFPADDVTDDALLAHGNEYRFDCIRTRSGWRIQGWVPALRWSYGNTQSHDAAAKQRLWLESQG